MPYLTDGCVLSQECVDGLGVSIHLRAHQPGSDDKDPDEPEAAGAAVVVEGTNLIPEALATKSEQSNLVFVETHRSNPLRAFDRLNPRIPALIPPPSFKVGGGVLASVGVDAGQAIGTDGLAKFVVGDDWLTKGAGYYTVYLQIAQIAKGCF